MVTTGSATCVPAVLRLLTSRQLRKAGPSSSTTGDPGRCWVQEPGQAELPEETVAASDLLPGCPAVLPLVRALPLDSPGMLAVADCSERGPAHARNHPAHGSSTGACSRGRRTLIHPGTSARGVGGSAPTAVEVADGGALGPLVEHRRGEQPWPMAHGAELLCSRHGGGFRGRGQGGGSGTGRHR